MDILKTVFSALGHIFGIFWRYFRKFQSVVGTILFLFLMLFIIVSLFREKGVTVPQKGALVISLEGSIQEQKIYDKSLIQIISGNKVERQTILRDVIRSIDLAAKDDRISLLVMNVDGLTGALPSKLHYIGSAMSRFRATGKKILIYGNNFMQNGYLIASYADEVYLNPYGSVLLYGYSSYQTYYKGFLDKIKAEVQLFRVGKYKSAMEPFIRSDMSPAAKEAMHALLGDLWADYSTAVEQGRALDKGSFGNIFTRADTDITAVKGDLAALAMQYKLVDGLKTREQWRELLARNLGVNVAGLGRKTIDYRAYLAAYPAGIPIQKDMVAVIYANGTIMDGPQPQGIAGGDTVSRHLREARLNNRVKAVVLRVDSPGGSAFASEVIRQEVLLLKKAGKPVVVSMGSLAASGGYWISASADEIWAAPSTITGSIGIFGAIPNLEGTLAAIGITTDGVGTTDLSVAGLGKPLSAKVKTIIQSSIENGYDRFLSVVAEGRHMTVDQVNDIAQGRVWSGKEAQKIGLVDKLGTFDDAVKSAATRANLADYKVAYWEDPVPWDIKLISDIAERHPELGQMLSGRMLSGMTRSPQNILAARIMEKLSLFSQLNDPGHAYVLCLACVAEFNHR